MTFEEWWIQFRGFDDPYSKDGFRDAFNAGMQHERVRCRYPECVEDEASGYKCDRWLAGDCFGPQTRCRICQSGESACLVQGGVWTEAMS